MYSAVKEKNIYLLLHKNGKQLIFYRTEKPRKKDRNAWKFHFILQLN